MPLMRRRLLLSALTVIVTTLVAAAAQLKRAHVSRRSSRPSDISGLYARPLYCRKLSYGGCRQLIKTVAAYANCSEQQARQHLHDAPAHPLPHSILGRLLHEARDQRA